MKQSLIHLTVPSETKARWVRASRAQGVKLTDYLINAVEHYMEYQLTQIQIPDTVSFNDLHITMESDGTISFDTRVIADICKHNGVDIRVFENGPEDNLSALINAWYRSHIENGGEKNLVMESLIAETSAENAAGQSFSHTEGHA